MSNIDLPRKKKGDAITAVDWNRLVDAIDEQFSAANSKPIGGFSSASGLGYTAPPKQVPGDLRSIFNSSGKGFCYTLNPFKVFLASDPEKSVSPTYENADIGAAPYPAISTAKPKLWLDTLFSTTEIISAKLVHEIPKDKPPAGQMRDILLMGETIKEGAQNIYKAIHRGHHFVRDYSGGGHKIPFEVTWIPPLEKGAQPTFTVRSNGGMISIIDMIGPPPFAAADGTMPEGASSFDAASIPGIPPFGGKFAYLVAEIKHNNDGSKKIEFKYEGSPYSVPICECDDNGRPTIARVCLAQYGGSQYVSTSLLMAPVFFGKGGYYIFTPFLSNPQHVPNPEDKNDNDDQPVT